MTPPPLQIGFTGTQHGMGPTQLRALATLLDGVTGATVHHGDCVGADAPPIIEDKRAHCACDVLLIPAPYLVRNRAIVDATEVLVATPKGIYEQQRSGTWSTVRYARELGRPLLIVYPNGAIKHERLA